MTTLTGSGPQWHTEHGSDTQPSVVSTLENLNAPASKNVYFPIQANEIRLVTIHAGNPEEEAISCSLSTVSQHETPDYRTLSYVWGSQEDSLPIVLNDTKWQVTRNLHAALFQLREREKDIAIWIDALSINQADISERNVQVSKMRTVYSQASSTIIWLCDSNYRFEPDIEAYLEAAQAWFNVNDLMKSMVEELFKQAIADKTDMAWTLKKAPILFMETPYWDRTWIVQEIMYSKNILIKYGTSTTAYEALESFTSKVCDLLDSMSTETEHFPTLQDTAIFRICLNRLPKANSATEGYYLDPLHWRYITCENKATDPRDTIFGYYGCFPPEFRDLISVDYSKPLVDTFLQMNEILIRRFQSLDVLMGSKGAVDSNQNLPSWTWIPKSMRPTGEQLLPRLTINALTQSGFGAGGKLPLFYNFLDHGRTLHVKGKACYYIKDIAPPLLPPSMTREEVTRAQRMNFNYQNDASEVADFLTHLRAVWKQFRVPLEHKSIGYFIESFHPYEDDGEYLSVQGMVAHIECLYDFERTLPPKHRFSRAAISYGVGPEDVQQGDKVCILQGCTVAVILRQVGDHHILIGEAKVPAVMYAQAAKGLEDGMVEVEDFYVK